MSKSQWIIAGSELSPFTLKLIAMCQYVGLPFRFLPNEGNAFENVKILWRKEMLVRGMLPLHWPKKDALDEYPLVPFLFGSNGENLYDSSAIAQWLDQHAPLPFDRPKLIPYNNEVTAFLCHLIDEYADEFGLYLAHHNRWVISATSNNAGDRLAYELRSLLGPLQKHYSDWFSKRQVRRLAYLFSIADPKIKELPVTTERQPPKRLGFPETHSLLDKCFEEQLFAVEQILKQQPFLLGNTFTLADASIYGELAMNLSDPDAATLIQTQAPTTFDWLNKIARRDFGTALSTEESQETPNLEQLKPLLKLICDTFVPLMQQNYHAYKHYQSLGETCFNELAFNKHRSLYDGYIRDSRYRTVVKTFQVKVWQQIRARWEALSPESQSELETYLPEEHGLDIDFRSPN